MKHAFSLSRQDPCVHTHDHTHNGVWQEEWLMSGYQVERKGRKKFFNIETKSTSPKACRIPKVLKV